MTTPLFESLGEPRWRATELARGPWDPRACHGGPVSALLARAVEDLDDSSAWQISRLTVELTRPVPVGTELELTTEVERPGRRVSIVGARLTSGQTEVARVRALRLRLAELTLPEGTVEPVDPPPGSPDQATPASVTWAVAGHTAFHKDACEHRFTEGSWDQPGPVATWIRLAMPVVDGETPTGVQRVAAAADFGNGVSAGIPVEHFTFINPDLTIHLVRPPVGEWVGLRSASHYGLEGRSSGAGMAESALYDVQGRLGRSVQSLLVDPR